MCCQRHSHGMASHHRHHGHSQTRGSCRCLSVSPPHHIPRLCFPPLRRGLAKLHALVSGIDRSSMIYYWRLRAISRPGNGPHRPGRADAPDECLRVVHHQWTESADEVVPACDEGEKTRISGPTAYWTYSLLRCSLGTCWHHQYVNHLSLHMPFLTSLISRLSAISLNHALWAKWCRKF